MEREQATKFIYDLLRALIAKKGSDLFITAGFPPAMKIDGKMTPVSQQALTAQHTSMLCRSVMNDRQAAEFEAKKECNFAIAPAGIGRFRVNCFVQMGQVGFVLRVITTTIPNFEDLKLPPVLKDIAMTKRGLVIFVGGTGSGKSTSLAAMIGYRNENSHGHIITIEDPVEFVHPHKNCLITQREVGVDTDILGSGAQEHAAPGARRHPHRRDPRPRDHGARHRLRRDRSPVLGDAAREQLQPGDGPHHQLLPRGAAPAAAHGPFAQPEGRGVAAPDPAARRQGRAAAVEILLNSPLISDLIFKGEIHEIKEIMKKSRELGMQTFDQALFDLYEAGRISYEDALRFADSTNEVRLAIKLHGKEAKDRDLTKGIEHLDIV